MTTKYETSECVYTLESVDGRGGEVYSVSVDYKHDVFREDDLFEVAKAIHQDETYYYFTRLPALFGVGRLYDGRWRSLPKLLNAYEDFVANY